MGLDENKAVAQRLYDELFNRGRLSAVDELVAPGFVCHAAPSGTPVGPRGMWRVAARLRDAFPDGRFVIEDLIAEDERVAVRLMFRGTHRDANRPSRLTARHVEREQVHVLRLAGGQVAEHWGGWGRR